MREHGKVILKMAVVSPMAFLFDEKGNGDGDKPPDRPRGELLDLFHFATTEGCLLLYMLVCSGTVRIRDHAS